MIGTIRVVSKRAGGLKAAPEETVIPCDRRNPVLGNRHILHDHRNPVERAQVIAAYDVDLEADFKNKGPMWACCVSIAARVRCGEKIALECWCAAAEGRKFIPCHGHSLQGKIEAMIAETTQKK